MGAGQWACRRAAGEDKSASAAPAKNLENGQRPNLLGTDCTGRVLCVVGRACL